MITRAICFDLDDTLYEYREYARAGLASAADRLEDLTGQNHYEELETMYFEDGITDGTFDRLLQRHGYPAEFSEDLVTAFHDATSPLQPYSETVSVLSDLSSRYKLGLITDGREGESKLRRLSITDYFDEILVTPTTDFSKRHSVVFEWMLDTLGVAPRESVYVGDDPRVDFEMPNHLGMRTVRLRRGRYKDLDPESSSAVPDHEIEELRDIRKYV